LPVWIEAMRPIQKLFKPEDFKWPEGVYEKSVSRTSLLEKFPTLENIPDEVKLMFAR
jgi:hypothetical protein